MLENIFHVEVVLSQRENYFFKVLLLVGIGYLLDALLLGVEKNITMEYLSFVIIHSLKEGVIKNERITEQ